MTKPTDYAVNASRALDGTALASWNRETLIMQSATIIDREAVAPAVRELVRALKEVNDYAFAQAELGHGKIIIGMNEADKVVARYRHLIEESGE